MSLNDALHVLDSARTARDIEAAKIFYNQAIDMLMNMPPTDEVSIYIRMAINEVEGVNQKIKVRQQQAAAAPVNNDGATLEEIWELAMTRNFQSSDADKEKRIDAALQLYEETVSLLFRVMNHRDVDENKKIIGQNIIAVALDRMDVLKGLLKNNPFDNRGGLRRAPSEKINPFEFTMREDGLVDNLCRSIAKINHDPEVAKIILQGSKINNMFFPVFSAEAETTGFEADGLFVDPDNDTMQVTRKQVKEGCIWRRPRDFIKDPRIIRNLSYYSITQSVAADCSFVSSLAVCASWERRFEKPLISCNLYPQINGIPVISPSGKYRLKLLLNGSIRCVEIDDRVPATASGQMLCSRSSDKSELWVSLMEKAYLKVYKGYTFPGSHSTIDLHALCGWIPERVTLENHKELERLWSQLLKSHRHGCGLFTTGTKELSNDEEEKLGLCTRHAYAIVDVREVEGQRLVKLKNPWGNKRWKGEFSPKDAASWTPVLRQALEYSPEREAQFDNGVFWISWSMIQKYYATLNMSWNPKKFNYRKCFHGCYNKLPYHDSANLDNPQYRITANVVKETSVWLLLSRHVTDTDSKDDEDAIAVHVYASNGPVDFDDNCSIRSKYLLGFPFSLVKMKLPPGPSDFTAVVASYKPTASMNYTLWIYSKAALEFTRIVQSEWVFQSCVKSAWTQGNAGGNRNYPNFHVNPQVRLNVTRYTRIRAKLMLDSKDPAAAVNVYLYRGGDKLDRKGGLSNRKMDKERGNDVYYPHFAYGDYTVGVGSYILVLATYDENKFAEFTVAVQATERDSFTMELLH